ncbi:MAG: arabinogalactan endo-1,4-beta-galactosidase [Chitinophagaceae bacterium]|nr:arabinogalactan endo-1,4-beta-galactosidase [Chitinophagaceae bacterium]
MKKLLLLSCIAILLSLVSLQAQTNNKENILGADISFLPQLEARGIVFSDKGVSKDAILLLKEKGFNYIRLRIFVNPAADSGYSPKKGFCDLAHTLQMAKRIKAAGLKILLDFHYSDTWADPEKQFKPAAWEKLSFSELTKAVKTHTIEVLAALKKQNTFPDMIQVGNEINHGMLWPDGNAKNMDQLAKLLKAGIKGVRAVDGSVKIMLHIALGGQNEESRTFLDQIIARKVKFDIIGQSYYPQWHGTLEELKNNTNDLANRYPQDIVIVEYTAHKTEVNDIAFSVANKNIKGTFIWEPLNTWEYIFEKDGKSNALLDLYPQISKKWILPTN